MREFICRVLAVAKVKLLTLGLALGCSLASLQPATAATVIDFENFQVGDVLGGFNEPSPFLDLRGVIVLNPDGNGKVLQMTVTPGGVPHEDFYVSRLITPGNMLLLPDLGSFDVFSPGGGKVFSDLVGPQPLPGGEWTTYGYGIETGGFDIIRVIAGKAFLDNIVINSVFDARYPEPASWLLLVMGIGAVGTKLRSRQGRPSKFGGPAFSS